MKTITTINFNALSSPLRSKEPLLNRLVSWLPQPLRTIALLVLLPVTIIGIFGLASFVFFIVNMLFSANLVLGAFFIVILILVFAWAVQKQRGKASNKTSAIEKFARQNGWKFGAAGPIITGFNQKTYAQSAPEHGVEFISVQGKLVDHDFELLIGWKDRKSGTHEQATPTLFVRTRKKLPDAVLISRDVTDEASLFDKLFINYEKAHRISLEGDFDQYFQLYVSDGAHIEAMAVIAPDFMDTAKRFINRFNIELSGSAFALSPRYQEISQELVKELFEAAAELITETSY